jgi:hypothetical protein
MFNQRRLIKRLGLAVMLLGLFSAGLVYWSGENDAKQSLDREVVESDSRDDTLAFEDSKTSSRGTEMYLGKVGVLIATWLRRWQELKNSQRLAIMIATGSTLTALACFFGSRFFASRIANSQ